MFEFPHFFIKGRVFMYIPVAGFLITLLLVYQGA